MNNETLIVYYSRSGVSEKLAQALQTRLGCAMDKVTYAGKDSIAFGTAVLEALRKATVPISGAVHNPGDYETIICITPVWGQAMATPMRSYLAEHKEAIKSYALIAVCAKSGLSGTVKDAVAVLGKKPVKTGQFIAARIAEGDFDVAQCI
jgi:flavodoxin